MTFVGAWLRNDFDFPDRRFIGDPEFERDAALLHALEVANAALQQFRVGDDDLLFAEAAQTGCLHADIFHRPSPFGITAPHGFLVPCWSA